MKQEMKVTTEKGSGFTVDISPEACAEFGVKHGDRVIHAECLGCSACEIGTPMFVVGVMPRSKSDCRCSDCQASSRNALWVSKKEGSAEIAFFYESTDDFFKVA